MHKLGLHAIQQTESLAEDQLRNGMMNGRPDIEIKETVKLLASKSKYFPMGL